VLSFHYRWGTKTENFFNSISEEVLPRGHMGSHGKYTFVYFLPYSCEPSWIRGLLGKHQNQSPPPSIKKVASIPLQKFYIVTPLGKENNYVI